MKGMHTTMKEKMLAEWKQKNDILEFELYQAQKKLTYARQRQQSLLDAVKSSIIYLILDILVLLWLFSMEGGIMMGLNVLYAFVVRGGALFTVPYFTYRVFRAVQRKAYHSRSVRPWIEPKKRISVSTAGVERESSYQAEIEKLSWVCKKYEASREEMVRMYKRLQEDWENIDENEWQDFLDSIIIYETIRPAQP